MNIPIIYGKLENSKVTLTKAEFEKAINDAFEYGKYIGKLEINRPVFTPATPKLDRDDSITKTIHLTCQYFDPEEIK